LLKEKNLCEVKDWYVKIIQLYEISLVRHGIVLLGSEGSGKSTILNTLMDVLSEKIVTKAFKINPKSVTVD
jgi:dynein heavy chain, axonemal